RAGRAAARPDRAEAGIFTLRRCHADPPVTARGRAAAPVTGAPLGRAGVRRGGGTVPVGRRTRRAPYRARALPPHMAARAISGL
ncbi:hypothetical protein DKP78_22255, partial [Enterococcus faecium]